MARRDEEIWSYGLEGKELLNTKKYSEIYKRLLSDSGFAAQVNKASVQWMKGRAAENLRKAIVDNRRPQFPNRSREGKSLKQSIYSDKSHEVRVDGWRFMVEAQVRPENAYAFALEYGDDTWVNRKIFFLFLGRTPQQLRRGSNRRLNPDPADLLNKRGDTSRQRMFNHRPNSARGNKPASPGRAGGVQFSGAGSANRITDRIMGPRELGRTDAPRLKGRQFRQSRFKVLIRNPVPAYAYGRDAGDAFVRLEVYKKKAIALFNKDIKEQTKTDLVPGSEVKAMGVRQVPAKPSKRNR